MDLLSISIAKMSFAVSAEVEIYDGTRHGFAFPKRSSYDKPAAERHWERMLALFGRALTRSASTA